MASLLRPEPATPDDEQRLRPEPDTSQTVPAATDAARADVLAPPTPHDVAPTQPLPPSDPAPQIEPREDADATGLPPPPETTDHEHEPPSVGAPDPREPTSPAPVAVTSHRRSRWRGPLGIAAALAAAVLLLSGGMAAGRATAGTSMTSAATPTAAARPSTRDLQQTVINVIHVVQPSVVEVTSSGASGLVAIGSGEVLTPDGYIVTNHHVVRGFTTFKVTLATGQTVPAQLVGAAPQDDLAVLRIHLSHLVPITIGDSSQVQVGEFAIAMGSPLGLQQSATLGIVSALDRQATEAGGPILAGLIQTSAPINPGNSGGALVDLDGHLIGIPTLAAENPENGAAAGGIGFAIPSDRVRFVADQLMKYGHMVNTGQGFLGIQAQDVTPQLAAAFNLPVQSGVLIAGFADDTKGASPAARAGLRQGDIVVAVNGTPVANEADLAAALITKAPGTQVSVTVQRGSSQQTAQITLGERPAKQSG